MIQCYTAWSYIIIIYYYCYQKRPLLMPSPTSSVLLFQLPSTVSTLTNIILFLIQQLSKNNSSSILSLLINQLPAPNQQIQLFSRNPTTDKTPLPESLTHFFNIAMLLAITITIIATLAQLAEQTRQCPLHTYSTAHRLSKGTDKHYAYSSIFVVYTTPGTITAYHHKINLLLRLMSSPWYQASPLPQLHTPSQQRE